MHNTLTSPWRNAANSPATGEPGEDARGRMWWLAGGMIAFLIVIGVRLAYVQTVLPDGLLVVFDEKTESFEEIPARDGRILSADGVPLADSEERYDLLAHYRWIEEPADADWVKQHARSLLSRKERRDPENVAAAEASVVTRRNELWGSLSELTGKSVAEIAAQRELVQERVERIWKLVEVKRRANSQATANWKYVDEVQETNWVGRFWQELTTPPTRTSRDPLVIAEQEDEHVVLENLDPDVAAEIETHPERFPGLRVVLRTRRTYPEDDLAAHLIGSRTAVQPEEIAELSATLSDAGSLSPGDAIGRSGLERSYDAQLRGRNGLKKIVRNRRREIVATEVVREAQAGEDVVLTFDTNLQRRAEHLLDELLQQPIPEQSDPVVDDESNRSEPPAMVGPRGACLVALDVRTGAVLAAASAPRFDLNLLTHSDPERWQAVLDDPRRPLFPRVTQMALPPGSTFKTLSAIALIEDGGLAPEARFVCQGYLDRPDKDRCLVFRHYGVGHNETGLADALGRSCNVYFFTAARHAGPAPLVEWSRKLGIGQPTGIDIPGEAAGSLPSPDQKSKSRRKWYPGDTLGLVIGQSSLLVTPLQMARLMAAVANDGRLVTPHLATAQGQVQRDLGSDASVDSAFHHRPQPKPIPGLHPETLAAVREGLERVVQHRTGTAYKTVRLPNVMIAGKTGTAEVGGRLPDHAWFVGYVPADEPKVAFVIIIEHGGSGGKVAGPVAREFVKTMLDLGVIHGTRELAVE